MIGQVAALRVTQARGTGQWGRQDGWRHGPSPLHLIGLWEHHGVVRGGILMWELGILIMAGSVLVTVLWCRAVHLANK